MLGSTRSEYVAVTVVLRATPLAPPAGFVLLTVGAKASGLVSQVLPPTALQALMRARDRCRTGRSCRWRWTRIRPRTESALVP